jgi:hypothetical protein
MPETTPIDGNRRLSTGLSHDDLDPTTVFLRTEVLLAQAETLGRLLRTKDGERKLMWTFAVAHDCFTLHPDSPLAVLNAARVARAARQFDLAAKLLRIARSQKANDDDEQLAITIQERSLQRERDIDAGGSREQMEHWLIVYACQQCGRLTEYISTPCMFCGWQPKTIEEVSRSGRLSTQWFSLWELLGIGRGIITGRKATEVVSNLAESAASSMTNPNYKRYVENALQESKRKQADGFYYYIHSPGCQNCGASVPLFNPFIGNCSHCQAKLRVPPPMRLLSCLGRTLIHFQHNFAGEQSSEFDLFIRYLVSLQSKLFRTQETPSPDERKRLVELMSALGEFRVGNNYGGINVSDPNKIGFKQNDSVPQAEKVRAVAVLEDFMSTLQVLADWMFRTKALC